MPDGSVPRGQALTDSLRFIERNWLQQTATSDSGTTPTAVTRQIIELTEREIPNDSSGDNRHQRRRIRDQLASLTERLATVETTEATLTASIDSLSERTGERDVTATDASTWLVVATGVAATAGVLTVYQARFEAAPNGCRERTVQAISDLIDGEPDAALDASVTVANQITDSVPIAARVDQLVRDINALELPSHADLTPLVEPARAAIRTGDESRLQSVTQRIENTAATTWTKSDLLRPTPDEFESLIADLWTCAAETGTVKKTRRSDDAGVDVVVTYQDGRTGLIQVKQYSPENRIGRPTVQQTNGAISQFNADDAYVVTTSQFTDPAVGAAESMSAMRLVDGDTVLEMLADSPLVPPRAIQPPK